ncbi:uncharacterized protein LOC118741024 [Rhagoletis pomonella]|uniref:uncharacterized protein LOC118741024 n=1 Tax=Rhagoletis pomonella TaxID=28610 RepID=UPI001782B58B|nr:uncharacterized protein LOC118741024 [Rhagoletis pomonella]
MPKTSDEPMEPNKCRLCCRPNSLCYCKAFRAMTPEDRHESARAHKYCVNCLATSHATGACDSPASCHRCGRAHHTLLHRSTSSSPGKRHKRSTQNGRIANRRTIRKPPRSLQSHSAARRRHIRELLNKAQAIIEQLKELLPTSAQGRHVEDMDE